MKLRILSDLHLEFGKLEITKLPEDEDTILILAGDIHVGMQGSNFVMEMCVQFKEVIYVLGNHEFYGNHYETILDNWKYISDLTPNLHVLEDTFVILEGVLFVGGTMWTDVNKGDWFDVQRVKQGMTDFRVIEGFDVNKSMQIHQATKEYFINTIKSMQGELPVVVITHHLPVQECIVAPFVGSPLNSGFASTDLDEVLEGVDLWVYGHTHKAADFKVRDTRLVCNPRGYHGHEPTEEYNDTFGVEI